MKRIRVIILGKVHGVSFRASAKEKADSLGVSGWIKNNQDGTVEAIFEGEEKKIEEILRWCREGPDLAKVKNVKVSEESYKGEFKDFKVK